MALLAVSGAGPGPESPDRISAQVVRVIDGDTLVANIPGWPPIIGDKVPIRVRGLDCPEIRGDEAAQGRIATEAAEALLPPGQTVTLHDIERRKYFRIVADVRVKGRDLATLLVEFGGCSEEN